MAGSDFTTLIRDSYRIDTIPGEHGSAFNVVRCQHVAHFDDEEHAAFLVELLTKGQGHGN